MTKLYSKKKEVPQNVVNATVTKLSKQVDKLAKVVEVQRRSIVKLDKQIKYLKDRVSNTEQKISYSTRAINTIEGKVQQLMGIFKR
jgi:septal ring factor EnvC (AmiA/AmiB activator)